ncbi:unnamed protein product [Calicophoron daubneyi]|uniref:Drebrin-like protein n=1 Tax=Calicophoron daubneyi TaxID=300641 RepID=A0AAV2TB94_CALDB
MSIDLNTNGDALKEAVDSVLTKKYSWAVFGYSGSTFTLGVINVGMSRDSMFEEFALNRVMFGYARVDDSDASGSSPPKFVFIYWQGEGAPEKYKLACTRHGDVVKTFCRTVHVTVHARSDDDLDWDEIMSKIGRQSGTDIPSSPHPIPEDSEAATPNRVGSVYKPTDASLEIPKNTDRMSFWKKQQSLETSESPKENKKPLRTFKSVCEESPSNNEATRVRIQALKQTRHATVTSAIQDKMKALGLTEDSKEDHSSGYKKIDPRAEIINARKQAKECNGTDEENNNTVGTSWHRTDPRSEILASRRTSTRDWKPEEQKVGSNYQPPDFVSEIRAARAQRKSEMLVSDSPTSIPASPINQPTTPPPSVAVPTALAVVHPVQPVIPPLAPATRSPPQVRSANQNDNFNVPTDQYASDKQDQQQRQQQEQQTVSPTVPAPQSSGASAAMCQNPGLVAVCLYDYTAAEDDELSFAQGDKIFQIEQIDEGWWVGVTANGQYGLFPANYVELIA